MRWLLTANVAVLAVQPILLIFLLFGTRAIMDVPVWGRGIAVTWAFFIPLWVMMGPLRGPRPTRWQRGGFLLTSFVLPVASAAWWGESLGVVLLDLASYNTLGASVAVGLMVLGGPFFEVRFDGHRATGVRMRKGSEILKLLDPLPVMVFVSGLLLLLMVLGPIGAEVAFIRGSDRGVVSLLLRYASLVGEVVVIGSMVVSQSIYATPPAPPTDGQQGDGQANEPGPAAQ